LTLILCVTILALAPATGLHIPVSRVVAACLMLLLVGTSFGSISLAVGCVTGRRTLALGIAGGFAAFAYVLNVLAPVVPVLQPIRPLSPFRWYLEPDPLVNGVHAAGVLVLLGITLVAMTVAFIGFERRDLAA
jgi:ABC-2 type transport system permease protein